MKTCLEKVFGGIKMTWLRLVVFSVVTAVITAIIMLLPISEDNPFRDIGIGYACWFIFAIFVISNCESALDAGKKTFVFFLISQPLIYLLQQPFAEINLIKTYYMPWFIKTFFTFPGAMLAYQIKKEKFYSPLILAVAGILLSFEGTAGILQYIFDFNLLYIIYPLLLLIFAILIGLPALKNKRHLIVYWILIGLTVIATTVFSFVIGVKPQTESYDIEKPGNWNISRASYSGIQAYMEDEDTIKIEYKRYGQAELTCTNENEESINIIIEVKNGEITIKEN